MPSNVRMAQVVGFVRARLDEEEQQAYQGSRGQVGEADHVGMHTVACGVLLGYWAEDNCTCGGPQRRTFDISVYRRLLATGALGPLTPLILAQAWRTHPEFKRHWRIKG